MLAQVTKSMRIATRIFVIICLVIFAISAGLAYRLVEKQEDAENTQAAKVEHLLDILKQEKMLDISKKDN